MLTKYSVLILPARGLLIRNRKDTAKELESRYVIPLHEKHDVLHCDVLLSSGFLTRESEVQKVESFTEISCLYKILHICSPLRPRLSLQ